MPLFPSAVTQHSYLLVSLAACTYDAKAGCHWFLQILALFEWLVDPCIAFVRRNCREVVTTADINLPVSLMNLFSSLLGGFRPNAAGETPVCSITGGFRPSLATISHQSRAAAVHPPSLTDHPQSQPTTAFPTSAWRCMVRFKQASSFQT